MAELRLRALRDDDEDAVRAAQSAMVPDDFEFAFDLEPSTVWADYVRDHARRQAGIDVPADRVPASFLVAEVAGEIVGRASIRHELNEWLRERGGHIGYGVLPPFRRRGYATEILRQSLVVARAFGVTSALVVCDDANEASVRTIERCGGRLDDRRTVEDGGMIRRYWID